MAFYELSDQQIIDLKIMIMNARMEKMSSREIMELLNALSIPLSIPVGKRWTSRESEK